MGTQFDSRSTAGRVSVTTGANVLIEFEGAFDHVNATLVMAMVTAKLSPAVSRLLLTTSTHTPFLVARTDPRAM